MAKESLTKSQLNEDLEELINLYAEVKPAYDTYKKEESNLNKRIKELMSKAKLTTLSHNGWTVDISTRESVSWDEDAVLEFMHKHEKEFANCIKTKEYVDTDVLEDMMYRNAISKRLQTSIKKFMVTKVSEVLKLKKG